MLIDELILSTAILSVYLIARIVYYVEANYNLNLYLGVTIFLGINSIYRPESGNFFTSIPFLWSIIAMLYFALLITRHDFRFPSYGVGKITKNGMFVINFFLFTFGIIFFVGVGYFWFNKIYAIYNVEEISNYTNVECYLENEPYFIQNYKVLYYTDSYIFIDILKAEDREVRVFPISILLDSSPCKENINY